jgi:hypothetical protein
VFPEARWGNSDPTRRQLAGRAQRAGVTVRSYIEVEYATALELAARGAGRHGPDAHDPRHDGAGTRARVGGARPADARHLRVHPRRNARLSPAGIALGEQHVAGAQRLSRSRRHREFAVLLAGALQTDLRMRCVVGLPRRIGPSQVRLGRRSRCRRAGQAHSLGDEAVAGPPSRTSPTSPRAARGGERARAAPTRVRGPRAEPLR